MIRELNFTDRKSLVGRFQASLFMVHDPVGDRRHWYVQVTLLKELIDELGLSQEWECWVEVYKSSRLERFRLGDGIIGDKYKDQFATGFDSEVYPLLRIKLVAVNDPLHRILASRARINPETLDERGRREHLLPLRYENLGQEPWLVREPDGSRPCLVVNSNLHRPGETVEVMLKKDSLFNALVLPSALRQILRARWVGVETIDREDIWFKFVHENLVVLDDLDDESSQADRLQVIDDAVKAFCRKHSLVAMVSKEEATDEDI